MRFRLLLSASLVIGLFLGNLLFIELGLYNTYRSADQVFHFLGGLFVAFFLLELFLATGYFKHKFIDTVFLSLLIFTGTVTVSVLWEFSEFWAQQYFGVRLQLGLRDTMRDLMLGSSSGFLVALMYVLFHRPK